MIEITRLKICLLSDGGYIAFSSWTSVEAEQRTRVAVYHVVRRDSLLSGHIAFCSLHVGEGLILGANTELRRGRRK
jgi:hypothetical protein